MSKYAKVTVKVPIDDALSIIQLRDHLKDALEERGIESLDLKPALNGEAVLGDVPKKGRVYWPAAEVVMTVERPLKEPAKPTKRARAQEG